MRRRLGPVGVSVAVLGGLSACGTPAVIPTQPPALADPCTMLTRDDIAAAFIRGIPGPATPLVDDESSRTCEIVVHDINGDEHLVVTVARNGAGAIASVCDPAAHPAVVTVTGIGSRACWNPADVSVSAVQHGTFFSAAIIDPVTAQDYRAALERVAHDLVGGR